MTGASQDPVAQDTEEVMDLVKLVAGFSSPLIS